MLPSFVQTQWRHPKFHPENNLQIVRRSGRQEVSWILVDQVNSR